MSTPAGPRPYIVGAVKIPYADRDVAHAVLTPEDDRGFFDIIGADTPDQHDVFPVGAHVTYRVELTDDEADRFRAASNCRYVELDTESYDSVGSTAIPNAATMAFMRADFTGVDTWHGRDVLVGLLDGGTTAAVRSYLGATMVAKQTFGPDAPGSDEITSTHGCLVAPCLIPTGGKFLDAIVSSNAGVRLTSDSCAAAVWCADQGAKVINYSGAGTGGSTAWTDTLQYLADRGIQFFASMGNDGLAQAYYPAFYSTTFPNCHSSISFDTATGKRSTFSNHTATADGCAPGTNVLGLSPSATVVTWSGTSASAPHMARLCAMGATGGRYSAAQVGAALKAHTRDTGQPDTDQGHGAYDLQAALTALGGITTTGADYHPVAIIWPTSDRWPEDGEADFMENSRPGDGKAEAYIHYPHDADVSVQQVHHTKTGVDLSQWHNFAYEWTPDGVTGYLDGVQWFHDAGGAITGTRKNIQDMPKGHLTLQLDNFHGSSGNEPATMEVDWVRAYTLTPQGTGGGGGGSTGTLADRWRIGFGDGLSKCNLGVDFLPNDGPEGKKGQHVDFDLTALTRSGGFTWPGYVDLRDDGAVRLTAYVGAATTPNSEHSRNETRQLAKNGVDKATVSTRSGTCYLWARGAVIRAPQGDPRICLMQWHAPSDDLCMIMWSGGDVISTFGDKGRPGTLATNVPLGSIHQYMIKIVGGSTARIEYYWDDLSTPKATQDTSGADGMYGKIGNYQQSDTGTDEVGTMAVVDLYDLEMWMIDMPEPAARH